MANDEKKISGVRIVLAVMLVSGLVGIAALLAVYGGAAMRETGVSIYATVATHLWSPLLIPAGVMYLLLLTALVLCGVIARVIYRKFFGKSEVWRQYRVDTFFWAEWQWDYSWQGKVINLWSECDKCAEVMRPKVVPDGESGLGVRFICNRCGKQSTTIRSVENEMEALERVEKKIMRKIRVGKYRGGIEGKVVEGDKKNGC